MLSYDEVKKLAPYERLEKFETLKKHFSASQIMKLLFDEEYYDDDYGYASSPLNEYAEEDLRFIQSNGFYDEIAQMAIDEGHVKEFMRVFLGFDCYNPDNDEILFLIKKFKEKGADEKKMLLEILYGSEGWLFTSEDFIEKLGKLGFNIDLISYEMAECMCGTFQSQAIEEQPDRLVKLIRQFDKDTQNKLFNEFYYPDWYGWYSCCSDECARELAKFYLENTKELIGMNPLIFLEAVPEEILVGSERSKEYREFLERVANGEDEAIRKDEHYMECAKTLLKLFK